MTDPFRQSIEGFDGDYPPYWNPEEHGVTLIGRILRYEKGTTEFGPCDIAVVIREEEGDTVSLWLTSYVLRERFREERPAPGERVGVKYLGKQEPKGGGKPYNNFFVAVDREGGQTPWDNPAPAPGPAMPASQAVPQVPSSGPNAPPFENPPPTRDTYKTLTDEWDNWIRKYRIEPWQEEAFARAHPSIPDSQEDWGVDEYRVALTVIRKHGTPSFERAAAVMAEVEPANQDDIDQIEEVLKSDDLSQKDRLRLIHARDTGWNDACFWAVQFGNSLIQGSDDAPDPSTAPAPDAGTDDDLPF